MTVHQHWEYKSKGITYCKLWLWNYWMCWLPGSANELWQQQKCTKVTGRKRFNSCSQSVFEKKKWCLCFSSERCVTVIAMRVTTLLLWVSQCVCLFCYQALSYKYLTVSIILTHRVYEDVHKSELNKRPDDLRLTKPQHCVHVILVWYLLVTSPI